MLVLDAFFALRPLVLIPAWSFFLLGRAASPVGAFPTARLLCLTAILLATHLVNQVVDVETDRINDKGFFLQRGIFAPRNYVAAAVLLVALALLGATWHHDGVLLLGVATLLGLAYSLPPLRLSHRPWADLLANALGYGAVAFVLGMSAMSWNGATLAQVIASTCAVGAVFLHTTLLDRPGDAAQGKRTTGVHLGEHRTRRLATVLASAAALVAAMAAAPHLLVACVVLALLAWSMPSRRICVWGTAAFALAAVVAFWWFGAALLLLVLATRRYYHWRFGIAYPSF